MLFELEENMNQICDRLGEAAPDEMDAMMEELGAIQDTLTMHDFYIIDTKVEEVARALGLLELGLSHDVTDLSGGQRTESSSGKAFAGKTGHSSFRRADELSGRRAHRVVETLSAGV